jgi:hypothetical protein
VLQVPRSRPARSARAWGSPYFIQELGYQVWAVADGDVITLEDVEDAKDAYEAKLDSSFFRVRLDRATQL